MYEEIVDIFFFFFGGGHHENRLFWGVIFIHFGCFFLKVKVLVEIFSEVAKISNIVLGIPDIPGISRCWVQAYVSRKNESTPSPGLICMQTKCKYLASYE